MSDDCGRVYTPTHDPTRLSFADHPMRLGTKLRRTMYLRTGEGKESDVFVGVTDTPELAEEIMRAVNAHYGHEES